MANVTLTSSPTALGIIRSTSTGAFSMLLFFALCWVGGAIGLPLVLSHTFIGLFTTLPVGSAQALWIGGLTAFVTGGVAGAIIAHCYNLAGRWFGD
jgi:hypothetical protein